MSPSAPVAAALTMGGGAGVWVDVSGGNLPAGAVVGGEDGEVQFIGRAQHEGALIPGKVVQSHGVCYVAWGGAEHGKPEYQVIYLNLILKCSLYPLMCYIQMRLEAKKLIPLLYVQLFRFGLQHSQTL